MNNIPFIRFLKQLLKNCQRIRSKRHSARMMPSRFSPDRQDAMKYYLETQAIVRRYLYDQLSPYGMVGPEWAIRYLLSSGKILKRLGKAAKKQNKILFLKTAFSVRHNAIWNASNKFDWRTVPFNEFNMDEYERIKNTTLNLIDYRADPF